MLIKNACDGMHSSLDVRFGKACDNNCSFCIERHGIDSLGAIDVDAMIKNTIASGIKDVLILGGEPFLNINKLLEYVSGIRRHVNKIYITTSLPSTMFCTVKNMSITSQIMRQIDGLNVSLQSTDSSENNRILNASSNHDRIDMLKILNFINPYIIRVSINLVKNGIDTKDKLISALTKLENIGCKHIKINELQNEPSLYVSYEEIMDTKMRSPYSGGCQLDVKIKGIKARLTLKRSCFLVEETRRAGFFDLLKALYKKYLYSPKNRFMVMYENGMTADGWLKKGDTDVN